MDKYRTMSGVRQGAGLLSGYSFSMCIQSAAARSTPDGGISYSMDRLHTTLCRPSVFSISSITPRVAAIRIVASAAMVGSK